MSARRGTVVVWAAIALAIAAATAARVSPAAAQTSPTPEAWLRGLAFPTNLAFTPDGRLLYTERETGDIRVVREGRVLDEPFFHVDVSLSVNETGLLGIAVDPTFPDEPWIYTYYTDAADDRNRLIRIRAEGDVGEDREVLLDGLPATNGYHNGGDLVFGADGMLYVAVGEGHDAELAQDPASIGGKILRLEPDGSVPPDNPLGPDVAAFSIGHRNSFGLCLDPATGDLWETENGPDVDDEINRLQSGGNFGWPISTGETGDADLVDPVLVFPTPIALTGCAVSGGTLYFGSFGESALRRLPIGDEVGTSEVVAEIPGGITDVAIGADGRLYVATSEAIWRLAAVASPSAPDATDSGGRSASFWIAVVAALVATAGLGIRFASGRRLRSTADRLDGPSGRG